MDDVEISADEAMACFKEKDAVFVDVRDAGSYAESHIPVAINVTDGNINEFIEQADISKHHIIYCYHGNSSRGGAAYFADNGFSMVHSLTEGFTLWSTLFPDDVESSDD